MKTKNVIVMEWKLQKQVNAKFTPKNNKLFYILICLVVFIAFTAALRVRLHYTTKS